MRQAKIGLAAVALAGVAGTCATAASPGVKEVAAARAEAELAQPAPVPGTFDFQLARLETGAARHAGPAAAPPAAAAAFDPDRPDVAVARRFVDAAWAFDSYTRRAGALDGAFADGAGVSRAVSTAAAYEPSQLAEGAVAWGALAALQDAGFVDAVRQAAPDAAAREALAAELLARPAAVLRLPGAREAALRVSGLVGARGAALIASGEAVHKASYAVQKQAWSKASLDKPAERLAAVKTLGARRAVAGDDEAAELMKAMTALRPAAAQSRAAPEGWRPTPAVARSTALAALALIGRAGEEHAAEAAPLLVTAQGGDCLKMAKLNLNQCLAVAGPRYEDMFCLGKHAVADTGQCLVSTAGWAAVPPVAAPEPRLIAAAAPAVAEAAAPPAPAPVAAPIALAALDGPERAAVLAPPPPEPEPTRVADTAAGPALEPAVARPSWSRQAADEDEADLAPPPPRRAAPGRTYAAAAPGEDEDEDVAARSPRPRYADARYDRGPAADDGADDDDAPPPRPVRPRWSPSYPAYGYAPWGGWYGPGAR